MRKKDELQDLFGAELPDVDRLDNIRIATTNAMTMKSEASGLESQAMGEKARIDSILNRMERKRRWEILRLNKS